MKVGARDWRARYRNQSDADRILRQTDIAKQAESKHI